ncbi:hypothetical protein GPK34_00900 [Secundilactobacillus kimchicus]|uniref:hypothetical protein n=1 Tax=Secundilactobacillus kimchicus TaxID=528209 RepID=UPI001C036E3F|nr:hypothetical protein [Secundilactobacillus kimchicus]MBT9670597.1 hypothetical protein [Secundilactobacillus kimchicus]
MSQFKTDKEFREAVFGLVKDEYTFLEPFVLNTKKIRVRHNVCGNEYQITPSAFFGGRRCRPCALKIADKKRMHTPEQFRNEVKALVGDEYRLLTEYHKAKEKVKFHHIVCGNDFWMAPAKFKYGRRCPVCSLERRRVGKIKTTEWYKEKVREILGDEYQVMGDYVGDSVVVPILHKTCGNIYKRKPRLIIDVGTRCPYCVHVSVGEEIVRELLTESGMYFEPQKTFDDLKKKHPLSYDFYIPDQKVLIEYQGLQHYRPSRLFGVESFKVQQEHDSIKAKYAEDNGFKLICIKYTYRTKKAVKNYLIENNILNYTA